MALLTFSLMHQLSQTGKLAHFQQTKHEIKPDMLSNLLNVEEVRLMKRLGGKEKWHYRFLNNGLVDVLGVSVSPDKKTITESYFTIEWGRYGTE